MRQELKARKKGSLNNSILPTNYQKDFKNKLNNKNKISFLIIILLIFYHLFIGNLIPQTFLKPFKYLINSNDAPTSFTVFTDSKFLGNKPEHGITTSKLFSYEKNKYIFPSIENGSELKKIGIDKLFDVDYVLESKRKMYSYSTEFFEDKKNLKQKSKTDKQADEIIETKESKIIEDFQSNGRKIYSGKNNIDIVLVTSLNFEKFDPSYLVKIIQNRVDYAFKYNFAVYSRWSQEFLPILNENRNDIDNWGKIFTIREAMFAFPKVKWFWYIDETSFIMRDDINIIDYLLKKESLEPIILRNKPLLPQKDEIKTYKNIKYENISLILTQTDNGINTNNFLIKNDLSGKSILDFWMDPLIRNYQLFRKDDSKALGHLLQWHPKILSKTAIIPPRTISSIAPNNLKKPKADEFIYKEGDLIINFDDCKMLRDCEEKLLPYWDKTQNKGGLQK